MKGKYRVIIQNKRMKYDFTLKRNITVIRGDSATGKTALVDMVREYYENGPDSGVELRCERSCAVLEGRDWKVRLDAFHESILFIDEGNDFVTTEEFASVIQKTDNYYVLVVRESLEMLPYSVEEIYGIRDSGKYGTLKQTYNELYHLYGVNDLQKDITPEKLITEDSNSGFQFFSHVAEKRMTPCISAGGKSNIFSILTQNEKEKVLVIADGAAFGSEMDKIMKLMKEDKNIMLYLPESFEWLILRSGLLRNREVEAALEEPWEYIDSSRYFSWERFFTSLLTEKTKDSYLQYSKRSLNPSYLQPAETEAILHVMEKIEL